MEHSMCLHLKIELRLWARGRPVSSVPSSITYVLLINSYNKTDAAIFIMQAVHLEGFPCPLLNTLYEMCKRTR